MPDARGAVDFDVVVVGAGISGVCAVHYLRTRCPALRVCVLEARARVGGTWDLFRYPGVRSDSDMHTLGFSFRPWTDVETIADGPRIREYIEETARAEELHAKARFGRRLRRARWSSDASAWTLEVDGPDGAERYTCRFLWGCTGYYRYEEGYTPALPGLERFAGPVVHPQRWPEGLELEGRRVLVIGSGATAMSLVPAIASRAREVIMLQRSPTYLFERPREDEVVRWLNRLLPPRWAAQLARWRSIALNMTLYEAARRWPALVRRFLLTRVRYGLHRRELLAPHFTPRYAPWDQRICLIADGDLFAELARGRARVVTDHVAEIDARGVQLRSGARVDADVLITATGLELQVLGGVAVEVDGAPVHPGERMLYKGALVEGVPNLAMSLGYTNLSWTIRCELTCEYVCRLLNHMGARGYTRCRPGPPAPDVRRRPLIGLRSGYVERARGVVPEQGTRGPWRFPQNLLVDRRLVGGPLEDGVLELS
ncbi:MAG: NAD(P)/FAD-dependent oxidoreductase [Myxococcales bacterium]|nr:NAD(P)/FAD-dependent oxidoreductase [Myxococcales bacterium]